MLDGAPQPAAKKRMLRIASGCATREAFVTVFRRFCDRDSIFIATKTPKSPGEELQFSITLADGKPLMSGRGSVIESWSDEKGPFGRSGMRIRFGDLSPDGRALIDELVAAAEADKAKEKPPIVPATAAAAALAAAALSRATPPRVPPRTPSAKIPVIKPLPSVIAKAAEEPRKTMLGLPPLKRPTSKPEGTPRPILAPRDVEVELPPPAPRTKAETEEQVTAVSTSRFTRDSSLNEAASWDEAASHALNDTRVRGSDEILPANPLGGVENDSLDAFVECTIYEETGAFGEGEPTAPGDGRPPDDWAAGDPTIPPWLARPLPIDDESTQVPAMIRPADLALDRDLPTAGPPREFYVPPVPPPLRIEAAEAHRSHWPITIGIAVVTCGVGMLIGILVANSSFGDPAEQPVAAAAPVVADSDLPAPPPTSEEEKAAPPKSEKERPAPPTSEEKKPAAAASLAAAADGERCDASIKSEPGGAMVLAAGAELGKTPLTVSLPCGAPEVEIRRARYANETRTLELAPGKVTKVEVDLQRPEHKLRVVSVPEGARVTVNGRSAGTTPVTTTVNGFEQASVSVEMSGYKDWSKRVYARSSTTSVTARLSPDKKSEKAASPRARRSN